MRQIFKTPYIYWFIGIFILYSLINIFASGFYNTIPLIINYASTINWLKLSVSIIFSIAIGILVAANSILFYIKYKERKKCLEGATLGTFGTIGGLATGVCPLCVTGLIPLILGIAGVSFSFASLPFGGIEVQVFVLIILGISFWMLNK